MTKEEAIDNIKLIRFNAAITNANSFKEALDMAIEALSQPSLPSNLDEAAEESWAEYEYREHPQGLYASCYQDGFKAGAEWMAGQGQTFEAHVDNGCAIASGVKLPFVLWDTHEDGDVLKVQIRKK